MGIQQLINKFWNNTADTAEKAELLKSLGHTGSVSDAKVAAMVDFFMDTASPQHVQQATRRVYNALQAARQRRRMKKLLPVYKAAAHAAVVLLTVTAVLLSHGSSQPEAVPAVHTALNNTQLINNTGAAKYFTLKDGSRIKLFAHSALLPDSMYNRASRKIQLLKGGAMFMVAKNAARPFIVNASGITTTALGTAFTVRQGSRGAVTVSLHEGKVVVQHNTNTHFKNAYLLPGDVLYANTTGSSASISHTGGTKPYGTVAAVHSAPAADLVFEHTPLQRVFNALAARYRVKIIFNSPTAAGLSFTGSIKAHDPLMQALDNICRLNYLQYTQHNHHIIITTE